MHRVWLNAAAEAGEAYGLLLPLISPRLNHMICMIGLFSAPRLSKLTEETQQRSVARVKGAAALPLAEIHLTNVLDLKLFDQQQSNQRISLNTSRHLSFHSEVYGKYWS